MKVKVQNISPITLNQFAEANDLTLLISLSNISKRWSAKFENVDTLWITGYGNSPEAAIEDFIENLNRTPVIDKMVPFRKNQYIHVPQIMGCVVDSETLQNSLATSFET